MRRPQATPESRARAERIARSLAGLLGDAPAPGLQASDAEAPVEAMPRVDPSGGLSCPRCAGAMQAVGTNQGVEIDQCLECGGIWLDAGELEALVRPQVEVAAAAPTVSVRELRERMREVQPPEESVKYRDCPRCGQVMRRINFGTISGVIVDECRQHGVLLDPGELQAIETFLQLGGASLGAQARLEQGQRAVPPAPESLRAPHEVRPVDAAGSVADVLWDLLFHW